MEKTFLREKDVRLIALTKEVPNLTISVTLSDLFEFGEELVRNSKKQLEQIISNEAAEKYLSPMKTAELLDVTLPTLWRYGKRNYLNAIEIGGKRRYRMSDINKILGKGTVTA